MEKWYIYVLNFVFNVYYIGPHAYNEKQVCYKYKGI